MKLVGYTHEKSGIKIFIEEDYTLEDVGIYDSDWKEWVD